ncbi:MAG: phosphatidylserine decarboxylase family protein [Muribaculaceae bacterium]|nr:phosphatidylserine decarboxylase family protein [Muribaculaceae bacterium]MDE5858318.1 phosphatidylserine decarboxylase family protein [Muribaculaceae bacterium]
MRVRLHHEGRNILAVSFLILLAINLFVWLVLRAAPAVPITVTVLSAIIFLLIVNFFRSPKRNFTGDRKNVVVASADGTVVALEEVFEDEYLHKNVIQLSIFMTILNVHANWFPVDGEVIYTAHHSGRFLSAYLPKSSTENERSTVVIRANNGQEILMRQVAGAIARRIVTYAQPGVEASIEDHMGFIKFGSRIDLYLPLGTEILVKIGDKTTGGITPVARLQSNDDKC